MKEKLKKIKVAWAYSQQKLQEQVESTVITSSLAFKVAPHLENFQVNITWSDVHKFPLLISARLNSAVN